MSSAVEQAEKLIPAEVRMFSGCRDEQTSADVSNVATFQLPDPAGRAGGACTSAMLKVLYDDHKKVEEDLSFEAVLMKMREILSHGKYTQIPQLTSSRPMDIHTTFDLVPPSCEGGTRRAILIGINYIGAPSGVLSGCHNDVKNMLEYIKDVHGFQDENCTILLDDGVHTAPTKANILAAYRKIVAETQPGDAVFAHYSGHGKNFSWLSSVEPYSLCLLQHENSHVQVFLQIAGAKIRDDNGDEEDGYDEVGWMDDGKYKGFAIMKLLHLTNALFNSRRLFPSITTLPA